MNDKYPPLTTAALIPYSSLSPFSEVASAEKMAELERKLIALQERISLIVKMPK